MITSSIEAILINKGTNQLKCFNNVFHVDITAHDVPGVISVSDNDIKGLGGDSEWVTQDKASDLMLLTGQIKKYQILSDQTSMRNLLVIHVIFARKLFPLLLKLNSLLG